MKKSSWSLSVPFAVMACLWLSAVRVDADSMRRNVLSEEQVEDLRTEVPGSSDGETVQFTASFGPQDRVSRRDRRRHLQAGSVPFHITADYVQTRMAGNRTLRQRLSGMVHLYVLDSDDNVVVNESLQVERMCPTWGGRGGYFGEVAKPGTYTAVIWVQHESDVRMGRKITIELDSLSD